MNNLSLFLYLAEVSNNLSGLLAFVSFMAMLATSLAGIIAAHGVLKPRWPIIGAVAALVLGIIAALLPSKETMYLIAGSEAGEMVVQSEQGQQILDNINKTINTQLEKLQ